MTKAYMIIHDLKLGRAGLTNAMLTRSKVFYEKGLPADIITFDDDPNYGDVVRELKNSGKMHQDTQLHNMINFFKNRSMSSAEDQQPDFYQNMHNQIHTCIEIEADSTSSRFFSKQTGEYVYFVRWTNAERTAYKHVDYFVKHKRESRFRFKKKKLDKIESFNEKNERYHEVFFNEKGNPFLNRAIHPEKQTVEGNYLLYNKRKFVNNVELAAFFIEELLDKYDETILICDGPGSFNKMLKSNPRNTMKIAVIHTNHFMHPYTYGSKVKKQEAHIIENANNIDAIVVFTEKQKEDVKRQYNVSNIVVIPNFQYPAQIEKITSKNERQVVGMASRLHETKGFDRLIEVAEKVRTIDSTIKFHVYGKGGLEQSIRQAIDEKHLQQTVFLQGYSSNMNQVIGTFDISISTSKYEAFGLSISEAMMQEVPVVAMDVRYGPSDLIEDGYNGYLVEDGDTSAMAQKIVELIHNQKQRTLFGKRGRQKVLEDLSIDKIYNKWNVLLQKKTTK
ncbi:glycosyltransferase [Shouchella sp. 1P09AA]|uniref:glycosyltransferase n=1 Tax=unclassified Shouchella TaxID=2893065 RepID=UPI0039A3909A